MNEFWLSSVEQTYQKSKRVVTSSFHERDVVEWLSAYDNQAPTSSNQGTGNLPFQRWFKFKEAFSPKFVTDTLSSLPYKVNVCLDPFVGSGTTAITCKMLGVNSIGTEVNPFLADLARSKITAVDTSKLLALYESVISSLNPMEYDLTLPEGMPKTFCQPGVNGRYIFSESAYQTIRALIRKYNALPDDYSRILKVILGSVLVENSNATINGKGRRYKKNWTMDIKQGVDVINSMDRALDKAIHDLNRFSGLNGTNHKILLGDCRLRLKDVNYSDVVIFSPPYPNSFDYTDVYNIELWMLGYLNSSQDNRKLRTSTLRSHVQALWKRNDFNISSPALNEVLFLLEQSRASLWNKNIPEMVYCYFEDLFQLFNEFKRIIPIGRHAIVAIGDSIYANVHIDVSTILSEVVSSIGFKLVQAGSIRSMRSSSQHGGKLDLSEDCLVYERIF